MKTPQEFSLLLLAAALSMILGHAHARFPLLSHVHNNNNYHHHARRQDSETTTISMARQAFYAGCQNAALIQKCEGAGTPYCDGLAECPFSVILRCPAASPACVTYMGTGVATSYGCGPTSTVIQAQPTSQGALITDTAIAPIPSPPTIIVTETNTPAITSPGDSSPATTSAPAVLPSGTDQPDLPISETVTPNPDATGVAFASAQGTTATTTHDDSGNLTNNAKIGIGVGVTFSGAAMLFLSAWYMIPCLRRRKQKWASSRSILGSTRRGSFESYGTRSSSRSRRYFRLSALGLPASRPFGEKIEGIKEKVRGGKFWFGKKSDGWNDVDSGWEKDIISRPMMVVGMERGDRQSVYSQRSSRRSRQEMAHSRESLFVSPLRIPVRPPPPAMMETARMEAQRGSVGRGRVVNVERKYVS